MKKDTVIEMDRSIQELVAKSEKEGCSSGGTEPTE